jgi:phage terminase large subunit-like protein
MARKNGKTALIAALVLVHLDGPEWEYNGEIYSAANEREQAGIVFKYVYQMIEVEPELSDHLKVVKSTKTIVNFQNGSTYKALSADAGSKFGLNPTVAIYDELAQAKNRDLFDALDTSMGARAEPLLIVISTQSPDPQHVLSELIDDGLSGRDKTTVVELHAVPDDCEDIFDPRSGN